MSATTTPATTTTKVSATSEWATPAGVIGIYSQTLLLAGLGIACYLKNENAIMMVLGAIVTSATTVVNYYMGSSKGSASKDATIASQLPTPPTPPGSTTVVTTPATQTVTTAPSATTTTTAAPFAGLTGIPTSPTGVGMSGPTTSAAGTIVQGGTVGS